MPFPALCRPTTLLALMACLSAPALVCAADDAPTGTRDTRVARSFELGYESIRLPAGERLGLMSGTLLFDVGDGWWFGPAVHGAAAGERGGLFVGGAAVERHWLFGPRWEGTASLFVGGGGGAGAPVGGGLMVRPAASLLYDFGPLRAGASVSYVRFPSGDISSRGFGIVLAWDGSYR